ncbi:MAG: 3-phosphoserine/phosphohydroxythreonine transaminase [Flavobacteriales bacterium]|nr:3-phosphoserine/phosphohydroxythreonine transaminase [Flavobacteriales bacterium]
MKIHNFSAGPSVLNQEVLKKASEAVLNINNSGLSLLEISHRSKDFVAIFEQAILQVRKMMKLSNDYEVLFLQGGASLQFVMLPYNLFREGGTAGYLETGNWSSSAIKEGKKFGNVQVVASSKDTNFDRIPKDFEIPDNLEYFHFTTNNTIYGTQIKDFSNFKGIKVCDMSSDILSRELDYSQFDLIYAGAQKNIGPAGTTLVVIKKELLNRSQRDIPSYLDYAVHVAKDGMFNTPPVFPIYATTLTLQWLEEQGGLPAIEKLNKKKANLLYSEIDRNPLFTGHAVKEDRSMMNVTFVLNDESLKNKFDSMWKEAGISGVNGHRSVGGYRASIYNALELESVQLLVNVMKELEQIA